MAHRLVLHVAALSALLAWAPACTKAGDRSTETPGLAAPETIADLDDFADARNAYALLPLEHHQREPLRARLRAYLLGYLDHALDSGQTDAAVGALEQLAGLWIPSELRTLGRDPEVAAAAERVYASAAPAGNERPALLALGLAQAFGDEATRARAEASYAQLEDWVLRTDEFGSDPRFTDVLDRLLEDVTSLLPTPFLVDQLADVYLTRYRASQRSGTFTSVGDPRIPFTGYLLARLYLRADDLDAAVAALERIETDEATTALRELIREANAASRDGRSPADLDQLTREFVPEPDTRLPDEIIRQSWGIVDNLARRSLIRFPDHPPAHLARARVLRSHNYVEAAIIHYERAFAGKVRASDRDDLHRAWSELAEIYQLALELRAEAGDRERMMHTLGRVEAFHARALETWPQRRVEPNVGLAWMTVAVAEYNAGRIDAAAKLMRRTVELGVQPAALSLLATISTRRGEFDDARAWLRRLEALADGLVDQLDRYDWQIAAGLSLGQVEVLAGERAASVEILRETLDRLNTLLSYPGLGDSLRAEFTLRRAQVFFYLGEIDLAMTDAREAQILAPEREDAFSDPLIFTVMHGHYDEATQLFAAALARDGADPLGVYYSLWLLDLAARLDRPAPEQARDFLEALAASEDADPWPRMLARHGLGQIDFDALAEAANDAREHAEAYFYEGLLRWRNGRTEACLELMAKVIEQQMMGDFEYQMAQGYLLWNELPKTARAALF